MACRGYRTRWKVERPAPAVLGTRLDRHNLSALLTKLMVDAGIKGAGRDGISAHALRHTAASDALDRCHDVRTIQAMLGHSSLATTQIYLRRANLDQMREAMGGRYYLTAGCESNVDQGTTQASPA